MNVPDSTSGQPQTLPSDTDPTTLVVGVVTGGLAESFDRMAAKDVFAPEAAGLTLAAEFCRKYGEAMGAS